MKPESGRTRGSKADPQIRLQRGDGSISAETMVMIFFILFLELLNCSSVCRGFERETPAKNVRLLWLPVQGTARAVPQYRWQYRTKVVYALRLSVMFSI